MAKVFLYNVHQNSSYLPGAGVKWQESLVNTATEDKLVRCTVCLRELSDYEQTVFSHSKGGKGTKESTQFHADVSKTRAK